MGPLHASAKRRRLEDLRRACRRSGVPLTVQKRVILEALLDLGTHPTADEIHAAVARRQPGISRTTVYRTLETLVRLGLVSKACHPGSAARFDGRTAQHHHLVCLRCERIVDVSDERLDALPLPDASALGFEISELRVQLRGLCRRCRKREEKP